MHQAALWASLSSPAERITGDGKKRGNYRRKDLERVTGKEIPSQVMQRDMSSIVEHVESNPGKLVLSGGMSPSKYSDCLYRISRQVISQEEGKKAMSKTERSKKR